MIVDGIRLLAMIKDGQIEKNKSDIYLICGDGTRLKLRWQYGMLRTIKDELRDDRELSMFDFMSYKFEVPEPIVKIDIQAIEEIDLWSTYNRSDDKNILKNTLKINEIIKALKQLDKEVNGNGRN